MESIIREARIEDAERLAYIHSHVWEVAYADILPSSAIEAKSKTRLDLWNRILQEKGTARKIVFQEDGVIIGFMVMDTSRDQDLKDKVLEITSLYFIPEYWGKGYAKHLVDFAVNHAKKNRYYALSLWVLEKNLRARKFYEKCDFFFDGTKKVDTIGVEVTELRYWNTLMGREPKWWRWI